MPSAPLPEMDSVPRTSRRAARHAPAEATQRLVVKTKSGVVLLRLDEIDILEAAGNQVKIRTSSGDEYAIREPLQELYAKLRPHGFIRVHRGTVIRAAAMIGIEKGRFRKAHVLTRGGAKLEIGRAEFHRLRALWQPGLLDLADLGAGLELVTLESGR